MVVVIYKPMIADRNPKIITLASADSSSARMIAEGSDQKKDVKLNWYQMFTQLPSDYYQFFKYNFNTDEIPTLINVAVLTGSLMSIDQTGWKLQHSLYSKSTFEQKSSNLVILLGNGKYQLYIAALFALQGTVFQDEKSLKTASNIVETALSTGLFVQLLKRITGRESPIAATESGGDWELLPSIKQYQKNQPRYYSFPSGHLSTAAAVMTVIANNYPDEKWLRPVGYSLLGVLGFSLVNEGMHWYSDLPLAYFIGYTFGNIVAPPGGRFSQNGESIISKHLLFTPSFNINGVELNAIYSF